MTLRSRFLIVVTCLASLVSASAATAQQLPPVNLTAPDGGPAGSAALEMSGKWLLVYVAPGAAPSDQLIERLGTSWTEAHATRVIFIVRGSVEQAKAHLASKGGEALAASARWYSDPDDAAWKALGFKGTMAVAGIIDGRVDWKLDGVIDDASVLTPAVERWLGSN